MKTEHYFRQLDQREMGPFSQYYFKGYGDDQYRKWCSYCMGAVEDKHPAEAQDVCPTYERFVADR